MESRKNFTVANGFHRFEILVDCIKTYGPVTFTSWLVGCFEDLHPLSDISAILRLEPGDNQSLKS